MVIGFGHPVYTVSDPRNKVIKEVARCSIVEQHNTKMFDIAERLESTMWEVKKMFEPRLVQRRQLPHDGVPTAMFTRCSSSPAPQAGRPMSSSSASTARSSARAPTTSARRI